MRCSPAPKARGNGVKACATHGAHRRLSGSLNSVRFTEIDRNQYKAADMIFAMQSILDRYASPRRPVLIALAGWKHASAGSGKGATPASRPGQPYAHRSTAHKQVILRPWNRHHLAFIRIHYTCRVFRTSSLQSSLLMQPIHKGIYSTFSYTTSVLRVYLVPFVTSQPS